MTVVCIAGMHRSGTSMVARALNLCGLYLGPERDISVTAADNPEGFWENINFVRLNDEILAELGGAWDLPPTLEPGWEKSPKLLALQTRALKLTNQFESADTWGWKDPRNSLTIELWRRLLPNIRVVICLRNPLEVVHSLGKRGYSSASFGFNLWSTYSQHLLSVVPPEARIITHYEAYFRDPRRELTRILEFAGMPVTEEQIELAISSIKIPLRHNRVTFGDLLDQKPPFEVLTLYRDLCAQAGPVSGPIAAESRILDNVSADDFQQFIVSREKEMLESRLSEALAEVQAVRQEMQLREQELTRSRQEIQSLITQRAEHAQVTSSLKLQLKERAKEILSLKTQLAEKEQAVRSLGTQLNGISSSRAWRTLLRLRQVRDRFAPKGSLQSRAVHKLANVVLSPIRTRRRNARAELESARVRASELFEASWYLENNPDVAQARVDPALHYITYGAMEGRDPGPNFSTGWYLSNYADVRTLGINPLLHYLDYGKAEGRTTRPYIYDPQQAIRTEQKIVNAARADAEQLTVFTICSKNFTAYARTLFESINLCHPNAETFLFLCDEMDAAYDPEALSFQVVPLAELDIPDVAGMSQRYNITEFNTAIKPYAFSYLFKKLGKQRVLYLDPDILLVTPLDEVIEAFDDGAECVLTPHILQPAENVEMSDVKMLQYGIYNLGFVGLRNTPEVVRIVDWWGRQLVNGCVIKLEEGLFVDQKWADLFPAFLGRVSILHQAGYNVAYWNLPQRKVESIAGKWYSNGEPLRFVHFSGHKLDDPYCFSSHANNVTADTIGDLNFLVKLYHERLYANGQAGYAKIPYAFSWNGSGIVNLHTPKPEFQPDTPVPTVGNGQATPTTVETVPEVLVIDSSTPRPDRDAGSLSTFNLLKIYVDLGYRVTFIPSDLKYRGVYTDAIRALGVRCLHVKEIGSIRKHLQGTGTEYNFIIMCRAPIAAIYLEDARRFVPHARIILDTIDLHYLRSAREAALDGSPASAEAAQREKEMELRLIRECDLTIVLSSAELEILKKEAPDANVRWIPLLFSEMAADCPPFEERKDFLFVGGFPHKPNIDAVLYFSKEILPLIQARIPNIKFHIVGDAPPAEVLALGQQEGVIVHGYVKDLTPLFEASRLSVVPLRYGAGIKGKIATSLAYGVPVIATGVAVEGMEVEAGKDLFVADDPRSFADAFARAYQSKDVWSQLSENGQKRALQSYSSMAGRRRIASLMQEIDPTSKRLELYTLRSYSEYQLLRQALAPELSERRQTELALIEDDRPVFPINGFCAVCGRDSTFVTSFMSSFENREDGRPIPNWREHLECTQCGFINRLRAAMHFFDQRIRPSGVSSIYITEQTTALFGWLKERHPAIVGSEFLGDAVPLGKEKGGLRNEDLTALTFPDHSFDYVLSFDVMEHVSDDIAALKEVYRCLRPGGTFLFTAPFSKDRTEKLVRARMHPDGSVEHLLPPEYRGNPVDGEHGSLCFRYFAWDLLDDMRKVGFLDPYVLHYWSRDYVYLGVEQFMIIGTKPQISGHG